MASGACEPYPMLFVKTVQHALQRDVRGKSNWEMVRIEKFGVGLFRFVQEAVSVKMILKQRAAIRQFKSQEPVVRDQLGPLRSEMKSIARLLRPPLAGGIEYERLLWRGVARRLAAARIPGASGSDHEHR